MAIRAGQTLLGRYELTERIAVGGMGEVWRAQDRTLGRTVAAKVLRPDLVGDDAALARLRTEARNSSDVVHPNVAVLLDYGEQDGSGFLVMEYVEGEPLSAVLEREGRLPPRRVLQLLAQCARGLDAVHAAGIVHRDVKPSNILITPAGTAKLTDFGISLGADQPAMTAAGMVMGTAQYLPPELALGKPATPPGDIYALGIVAYEALVGHRPYTGSTQVDIAFAHVSTPLPTLPSHVPAPVRELVGAMLAKDPSQRPAPAAALARTMEDLGAAAPAGAGGRRRREPGRDAAELASPAQDDAPGRRRADRSWRLPTWSELAADRRWLTAVGVGLLLVVVLSVALGTLALGETPPNGAVDRLDAGPADRLTVRNH